MYKRIIASLLLDKKKLVKGINFKNHKIVGFPRTYCKSLGSQMIDEIFICDLNSYNDSRIVPDYKTLSEVSSSTMTPLTFGGGLNTLDRIKLSFNSGSDKVYLSSILHTDISLVEQTAKIYGSQSIVAGINVEKIKGKIKILEDKEKNFFNWLNKIENSGVGEIKINFVDREGTSNGFDIIDCKEILKKTNLPIIFEGGLGSLDQIKDAFDSGIDSVGLGRMISFEDNNIFKIKQFLKNYNYEIR